MSRASYFGPYTPNTNLNDPYKSLDDAEEIPLKEINDSTKLDQEINLSNNMLDNMIDSTDVNFTTILMGKEELVAVMNDFLTTVSTFIG